MADDTPNENDAPDVIPLPERAQSLYRQFEYYVQGYADSDGVDLNNYIIQPPDRLVHKRLQQQAPQGAPAQRARAEDEQQDDE